MAGQQGQGQQQGQMPKWFPLFPQLPAFPDVIEVLSKVREQNHLWVLWAIISTSNLSFYLSSNHVDHCSFFQTLKIKPLPTHVRNCIETCGSGRDKNGENRGKQHFSIFQQSIWKDTHHNQQDLTHPSTTCQSIRDELIPEPVSYPQQASSWSLQLEFFLQPNG